MITFLKHALLLSLTLLSFSSFAETSVQSAADDYSAKNYKVELSIKREGINAGSLFFSLANKDKSLSANTSYKPSMVAKLFGLKKTKENTLFRCTTSLCTPSHTSKQDGSARSQTALISANEAIKAKSMIRPTNAQTTQSLLTQLAYDIAQNKTSSSYPVLAKNGFAKHKVSFNYDNSLTLNKRERDVVIVTVAYGSKKSIYWLAKDFNWAPVQIENYRKGELYLKGTFKKVWL